MCREHYTSIAPDEPDHVAAMCGCTLERDDQGIVRMYHCPMHDKASNALKTLEFLADQWAEEFDNDLPINGADFVQWFGEVRRLHLLPTIKTSKEGTL